MWSDITYVKLFSTINKYTGWKEGNTEVKEQHLYWSAFHSHSRSESSTENDSYPKMNVS